jgi:hypothetical protein
MTESLSVWWMTGMRQEKDKFKTEDVRTVIFLSNACHASTLVFARHEKWRSPTGMTGFIRQQDVAFFFYRTVSSRAPSTRGWLIQSICTSFQHQYLVTKNDQDGLPVQITYTCHKIVIISS